MGMILRLTLTSALISLILSGCSSKSNAPIRKASSVSNEASRSLSTAAVSDTDNTNNWTPIPNPPDSISEHPTKSYSNNTESTYNTSRSNNTTKTEYQPVVTSTIPNRDYSEIPKGSFAGDVYKVKHGDTLFYVAWITGNDYRTLAAKNNIVEPFHLAVGQVLKVGGGVNNSIQTTTDHKTAKNTLFKKQHTDNVSSIKEVPSKSSSSKVEGLGTSTNINKTASTVSSNTGISASGTVTNQTSSNTNKISSGVSNSTSANIVWRWPAMGTIIEEFSSSGEGNKGIDIAGSRGQSVVSAADGLVVYAGNALRGFGNLIIIKHNSDYISAYAHNDSMLVSEQQEVKAGQKIATMGSSGASSVRLHFEVRYKGRSVNPLLYLPQR